MGLEIRIPTPAPITLPKTVKVVDSAMNWRMMLPVEAPMALRTPISRRRSRTIMSIESKRMMPAPTTAPTRV